LLTGVHGYIGVFEKDLQPERAIARVGERLHKRIAGQQILASELFADLVEEDFGSGSV
jgi:hypothetical protein